MPEAALVRGVRGAQCGVGGGVGAVREQGERFAGQGLGEVGGREVVRRLVGRGEQGVEVRVGPVLCDAMGPAQAPAAGQKGVCDVLGGRRVEPLQTGGVRGAALLRYGVLAGEAWETVRRQRGSSAMGSGGVARTSPVCRQGMAGEMCRHIIEGGQYVSVRCPNFTRTGEFQNVRWTHVTAGGLRFEKEVCGMRRTWTGVAGAGTGLSRARTSVVPACTGNTRARTGVVPACMRNTRARPGVVLGVAR